MSKTPPLRVTFSLPSRKRAVGPPINNCLDAACVVRGMAESAVETFVVLNLNARHRLICASLVSLGWTNGSFVRPPEVFRPAIDVGASAIICAHNHPSGDCSPSAEDEAITTRLRECGELLSLRVLDSLILGDEIYSIVNAQKFRWPSLMTSMVAEGGVPIYGT